ncbi:MAG: methylmalonyl-CoA epimerase [Syntrophorhabdales bacterium]
MIRKLHHIGVAVDNIEAAAKFYEEVLGLTLAHVEVVAAQKTRVGFLRLGETAIELIQPSGPDSPLARFLETRGPGVHHICLEVDDIEREIETLEKKGATMIDRAARAGSHDAKVAFIHPRSSGGVLIELFEPPPA